MLLITFSKAFKESYLMLTKTQGYIYIKRRIKTSISTQQHHSLSCGCGILWYNHTHTVFFTDVISQHFQELQFKPFSSAALFFLSVF